MKTMIKDKKVKNHYRYQQNVKMKKIILNSIHLIKEVKIQKKKTPFH